jgi:nucleoside-diphosphate-sugar epimerase
MQTIAILGANGRLSNMVARAFHLAGYRVIAVTRKGLAKGLAADVEQRAADAMDRQALIHATRGADIIFNGLNPQYTEWNKYVLPMGENVIAAAQAHGALHLFPGNVYNYGRSIPALVGDSTPREDSTRKGCIRNRLERLFRDRSLETGVQTVIVRAGDFYGGKITGSWFDLFITARLAKGKFTYPGPFDLVHSWAYLPDLAETFVQVAGQADDLSGFEEFLFPGHSMTGDELMHHCETASGRELRRASVPWPLLRLGGLVVPILREVCEMSYLWRRSHRLDGTKLEMLLGSIPNRRPEAAVAAAIRDLGIETEAETPRMEAASA